jgi:hypothetical protein
MRLEQVSPLSPNSILTCRFELLSERRKSRAAALEEEPSAVAVFCASEDDGGGFRSATGEQRK